MECDCFVQGRNQQLVALPHMGRLFRAPGEPITRRMMFAAAILDEGDMLTDYISSIGDIS